MLKSTVALGALLIASGCQLIPVQQDLPKTLGEESSAYGYVPLDGLAIDQLGDAHTCDGEKPWLPLLQALPDISTRFSVADFKANGSLTFGPAKVTSDGQIYRAVLDYVNVDVLPQSFFIRKHVKKAGSVKLVPLAYELEDGEVVVAYEAISLERAEKDSDVLSGGIVDSGANAAPTTMAALATANGFSEVTIPIYVGIGMRLTADVRALKAGIGLTSLAQIGAAAEADQVSGTLTVQTLGINGRGVATALPLPSKLDQTTIENGLLALGSSRALLYNATTAGSIAPLELDDTDASGAISTTGNSLTSPGRPPPMADVTATPRVVGLYSPIGTQPALINAIYAELSKVRPVWRRPC